MQRLIRDTLHPKTNPVEAQTCIRPEHTHEGDLTSHGVTITQVVKPTRHLRT